MRIHPGFHLTVGDANISTSCCL